VGTIRGSRRRARAPQSAFFSTTLDTLLDYLGVRMLLRTGLTGDNGVLFTAADAFLRDFHLVVAADCVVSIDPDDDRHGLEHLRKVLDVDVRLSSELDVAALEAGRRPRRASR
jgi:nicotinamidase-related amidase